jgi:serine/threonine protein kinase
MLAENYYTRLIDFGVSPSSYSHYSLIATQIRSLAYMVQEIILGQLSSNKCDLWSAGVILYFMISGSLPFADRNRNALLNQIIGTKPDYTDKSSDLVEVLQALLDKNPESRFSVLQLKKLKWFSDNSYENLLSKH